MANARKVNPPQVPQEPPRNVQEIVDLLIEKHGVNLPLWADYPSILAQKGLLPSQVSDLVVDRACLKVKAKQEGIAWGLSPEKKKLMLDDLYIWSSTCGRYQVCKLDRVQNWSANIWKDRMWDTVEKDPKHGSGYPRYYDSMKEALDVIDKHHAHHWGLKQVSSNREELLAYERGMPIASPTIAQGAKKGKKTRQVASKDQDSPEADQEALTEDQEEEVEQVKEKETRPRREQVEVDGVKLGVCKVILEILKKASSSSPISKAGILEKLKEKFPVKSPEAMMKTLNVQIAWHLPKKGIAVKKNADGFWVS